MRFKGRKIMVVLVAVFALCGLTSASALASGKPFAETTPATSLTETTATLNGVVNPNGAETKYYFEYGPTASYGTKTGEVSVGSGTSNVQASAAIAGLLANKEYHFRVVAANSNGMADGADAVFRTGGKPTVETKPASSVTGSTATLNGIVNPRGFETKYYFEYGTTASYGSKTAEASAGSGTGNLEESKAITGLPAGVQYHFRIVATNSKGTTDGADQVFSTIGLPEFVVRAPTKFPLKFTGNTGPTRFTAGGGTYQCRKGSVSGEVVARKEIANLVFKWSECQGAIEFCTGTWETKPLTATLAYISKAEKFLGLRIQPAAGTVLGECENRTLGIKRRLLGAWKFKLLDPNEFQTKYDVFANATVEKEKFEGGETQPRWELESNEDGKPEPGVLAAEPVLTFASSIEVRA